MVCPFQKKTVKKYKYDEKGMIIEKSVEENFLSCVYTRCPFYKQEATQCICLRVGDKNVK